MRENNETPEKTWGFDGDDRLTRAARAMYGAVVEQSRQHTAELDLQPGRLRHVFDLARRESDRSAAILMFALLEDIMIEAAKRYLFPAVKGGWDEVTSGNGLLATANDRITLLALLGWVRDHTYDDLRLLKSIRNRFAHHAEVAAFEDVRIRSWIGAISSHERPMLAAAFEDSPEPPGDLSARQLYLMRSILIVTGLVTDLAVAPNARANRVAPGHVAGRDWERAPDNLKEVTRVAAEMVLAIACGTEPRWAIARQAPSVSDVSGDSADDQGPHTADSAKD